MINLSETIRKSTYAPLRLKICSLLVPEIYLAESVKDYTDNAEHLKAPWFKNYPYSKGKDSLTIIFYNVGMTLTQKISEREKLFNIHDSTGQTYMLWMEDGMPPAQEPLLDIQDSKDEDWVYRLTIAQPYGVSLGFIQSVEKSRFTNIKPEKDSLLDKIRDLLPEPEPSPSSAYFSLITKSLSCT